jgi:heavy metal sensor kinase
MKLPIRIRLTVVYGAVFCLGAALLEAGAYAGLKLAIYAIADRDLQSRLLGLEEFLSEHVARLSLARLQNEIKTHTALQPSLLRIWDDHGVPIYAAPALDSYLPRTNQGSEPQLWTVDQAGRPLRILEVRRNIKGREYRLWLATDLNSPFEVLHRFAWLLLFSAPIVMAASVAAGHWMAGRALSPVLAITTAARSIDTNDLSRRIAVPSGHDELQFLAETLNGMLQRIESGFARTTQFVANASHELRTPLAVIRATAEVALLRPASAESDREALHRILKESEKNSALLEDLLSLARADSGAAVIRSKRVDLSAVVRMTCDGFAPLARQRKIALRFDSGRKPSWVAADAGHLKRLLLILLDNATRYTPAGGWIDVSLGASDPLRASFEVRDSGIGISSEDLPHIFERFYRADPARNREEGGSGLGLAIAEWIVQAHRGSIQVESTPGAGSTFRVVLPRLAKASPVAGDTGHQPALNENRL